MLLGVGGAGVGDVRRRARAAWAQSCLLLPVALLGAIALDLTQVATAHSAERRYVVILDDSSNTRPDEVAVRHAQDRGADIQRVFAGRVDGYAAKLTAAEAKALARVPGVEAVGPDPVGQFASPPQGLFPEHRRMFASGEECFARDESLVNQKIDIDCADDTRVDVDVAVLDTPIGPELDADLNVVETIDCFGSGGLTEGCEAGAGEYSGQCLEDHGALVAMLIGGIDNEVGTVGVAPGARLWSVGIADKELGNPGACGGTYPIYLSDVVAGVEWTTEHADEIEVANLSLQFETPTDPAGEAIDAALEDAIDEAVEAGIIVVVPAGNLAEPLTDFLPAKYGRAITVTAMWDADGKPGGIDESDGPTCRASTPNEDVDDTKADDSNFGEYSGLVDPWAQGADIAAPGACTSTSSALTAGAVAVLASAADPEDASDVADIRNALLSSANSADRNGGGWDDLPGTSREPLLDVSDDDVFAPLLSSPFWAYTEEFEEACADVGIGHRHDPRPDAQP